MDMKQMILSVIGGLLIVVLLGFILSKLGKPYNTLLFTIHKILALSIIVYLFLYIRKNILGLDIIIILSILVMVLSIISLFATGAMMSIGDSYYKLVKSIHLASMFSLVGSVGLFFSKIMVLIS